MSLELQAMKENNNLINHELSVLIEQTKKPVESEIDTEKQTAEVKNSLNQAQENQKSNSKVFENNKKKYKLLQKYGDILNKVENLLGIMSVNNEDLSLTELSEKLDELAKSRDLNVSQISFTTYQNLISDITSELLNIEQQFQNNELSEEDANSQVDSLKTKLLNNTNNIPTKLADSKEELLHLISLYKQSFVQTKTKSSEIGSDDLIDAESNIIFDTLNNQTKELTFKVSTLSTNISNFEPNVDLTALSNELKSTDEVFKNEKWNYDDASFAVAGLKITTDKLFDEQQQKNHEHEKHSNEIKSLTNQVSEISSNSVKNISRITFEQKSERAKKASEKVEKVKDLVDEKLPPDLANQYAEVIEEQLIDDEYYGSKLSTKPNVEDVFDDIATNEQAQEDVENLKEHIKNLQNEDNSTLEVKPEDDEEKV